MFRAALLSVVALMSLGLASGFAQEKKKDPLDEPILDKTVGEWIKILRTSDEVKQRRVALLALEASDSAGTTGLPALLNAIEKDKEPLVRQEAVSLLGRLDPTKVRVATKTLVESLQTDKAGEVREAAAASLGGAKFIKPAADYIGVLAEALKDPHAGTRIAVAGVLRNMEEDAKPAFPALFDAAADAKEHPQVRTAAVHVVSRYAKKDPKTVPLLVDLLKSDKTPATLREAAAEGLGRTANDDVDAVAALCVALSDKSVELRKVSAIALGKLGPKAKSGWLAIKEHMIDAKEDSSVRNHLIRLTGVFAKDSAEAIASLTDVAVKDTSTENRIAAIQELGELPSLPADTRKALSAIAVNDARATIRDAAAKALKQ